MDSYQSLPTRSCLDSHPSDASCNSFGAGHISAVPPTAWLQHQSPPTPILPSSELVNHRDNIRACLQCGNAFATLSKWSHLPQLAIQRVAILLSSPQSFAFCASSRYYHAAQPKLRVLAVGCEPGVLVASWLSHVSLKELLTIYIDREEPAHMILERISARHGAEVTHLYLVAYQDCIHDRTASFGIKLTANLKDPSTYGRHLRALHSLHLVHPSRGASPGEVDAAHIRSGQALDMCAAQLIHQTRGTLCALCIDAKIRMPVSLVKTVLLPQLCGLEYIRLNLVPFRSLPCYPAGCEDDTVSLRYSVQTSLQALVVDPFVLCHAPAWQRDPAALHRYMPPTVDWRLPSMDDASFIGVIAV